jgi:hypothetical protein
MSVEREEKIHTRSDSVKEQIEVYKKRGQDKLLKIMGVKE